MHLSLLGFFAVIELEDTDSEEAMHILNPN